MASSKPKPEVIKKEGEGKQGYEFWALLFILAEEANNQILKDLISELIIHKEESRFQLLRLISQRLDQSKDQNFEFLEESLIHTSAEETNKKFFSIKVCHSGTTSYVLSRGMQLPTAFSLKSAIAGWCKVSPNRIFCYFEHMPLSSLLFYHYVRILPSLYTFFNTFCPNS